MVENQQLPSFIREPIPSYGSSQSRQDNSVLVQRFSSQLSRERNSLPLGPIVDGDVAGVTVVRAETPFMMTAVTQDGLRSIMNCLAGERFRARAIRRIHHIARTDAELSSIGVGRSSVDVGQSCITVGDAGAVGGPIAARGSNQDQQKYCKVNKLKEEMSGLYLFE